MTTGGSGGRGARPGQACSRRLPTPGKAPLPIPRPGWGLASRTAQTHPRLSTPKRQSTSPQRPAFWGLDGHHTWASRELRGTSGLSLEPCEFSEVTKPGWEHPGALHCRHSEGPCVQEGKAVEKRLCTHKLASRAAGGGGDRPARALGCGGRSHRRVLVGPRPTPLSDGPIRPRPAGAALGASGLTRRKPQVLASFWSSAPLRGRQGPTESQEALPARGLICLRLPPAALLPRPVPVHRRPGGRGPSRSPRRRAGSTQITGRELQAAWGGRLGPWTIQSLEFFRQEYWGG